ncbi:MAG: hypothetical protein H0V30_09240 [Chitinophagaceae bacterium]|nr:hypothetical protein [Chitinophagaceae bacterium]
MNKCSLALLLLLSMGLYAQPKANTKTDVLLLGTFHFDNPGLDVAKFESADIMSTKRQQEVLEVVKYLKAYKPEIVFIEATPESQTYYDTLVAAYKKGEFNLKKNEIYQLGFRLAKELDLPRLHCVDYRDAQFPFDSLVKVMTAAKQTDLLVYMKTTIDSIESAHNEQLKKATINEILLASNTKADQDISVGTYFEFLKAGDKDNHIGSYMASEWWRRNMIIYENILKHLTGKEKRILVLFGSSHTALLKEFMKYNPSLNLVEVASVLK